MNVKNMDAIQVEDVTKSFRVISIPKQSTLKDAFVGLRLFGGAGRARFVTAVEGVSFSVPHGATLGVIGRNGSGKTTLMRLLAGIYMPTRGVVRVKGNVAPLLSLGQGFHPDMTGRENVMINGLVLGLTRRQVESRFDETVDFAELRDFIDSPVRTYSSGMYMRLAFSIAVSVNPDVLLLDEVLSVGDEAFAAKCRARMKRFKEQGKTIVLVSHDPGTVRDWCETTIWMDRGNMRMIGPTQLVLDAYHCELEGAEVSVV